MLRYKANAMAMDKTLPLFVHNGRKYYREEELLQPCSDNWIREQRAQVKIGFGNGEKHYCSLIENSYPMYLRCEPVDESIHRTCILAAEQFKDSGWFDEAAPKERRYNHLCPKTAKGIVAYLCYHCEVDTKGRLRGNMQDLFAAYKAQTLGAMLQAERDNKDSDLSYVTMPE